MIGIRPPSSHYHWKNLNRAHSTLATLYNTKASGGSGFLLFFLIVFIRALNCAWKTGVLLWITLPQCNVSLNCLPAWQMHFPEMPGGERASAHRDGY
jgi:hypothetical protein